MEYDGMGHRLEMTAYAAGSSVTTQYVFDYDRTLTATSDGNTIFYLYGVGGVIGEFSDGWTYGLQDSANTQRQLTDELGEFSLLSLPFAQQLIHSSTIFA